MRSPQTLEFEDHMYNTLSHYLWPIPLDTPLPFSYTHFIPKDFFKNTKGEAKMRMKDWPVLGIVFLFALPLFSQEVRAADIYPSKPITFIVPIEAGSDGDILARPFVQKASAILGKSIVVVNKPGAGSVLGYRELQDAKPDGYTIGMGTITIVTNRLQGLMPLDYYNFTLLGTFYRAYMNIFGSNKTKRPFKTIAEVISFAKAHPDEVSLAAAAVGQSAWVAAMAFIAGTGIKINVIPQAGSGGFAIAQIAGGHADLAISHLPAAKPQIDTGNIRFLAVMGGERAPGFENVPTLKEVGYDVSWESCGIVMAPPGIPKEAADKLAKAFASAANDPEYHKFLSERFTNPFYTPPEKTAAYLDGRRMIVREIMGKAGILKEK